MIKLTKEQNARHAAFRKFWLETYCQGMLFLNPRNNKLGTRGRWPSFTKKGPGRRHGGKSNPAGSKLMKRFSYGS